MGIFGKKGKPIGNGRYFELHGMRFAIGVDYAIELTKQYNELNKCDAAINDVLIGVFGAEKLTASSLENMRFAIMTSLNLQAQKDGRELLDDDYFSDLIDRLGIIGLNGIIINLANSLITVVYGTGKRKTETETKEVEAKKKG